MVSRRLEVGVCLTRLGTDQEVELVSERVEGLVLHFIIRPDFRMVNLGMIWGRNRKTKIDDASVGRFGRFGQKSRDAPIVLIVTVF